MSVDLIQTSVMTGSCIFVCSVLHPLTRIRVSLFVGETSALLGLNLIFHKSFLRIFGFHPKQSEQQTVTSLQKTTAPTSVRPLHSMEFIFLCSHFSFFLSLSLCFLHQQMLLSGTSTILSSFLFHNLPHTAGQTHSFMLRHTHTHTHTLKC